MKESCILLLTFCCCTVSSTNVSSIQHHRGIPLYFGLMLSLSGDQQSTGALAGVQAALDDINTRDDLLSGYSLHYALTDSQCNRTAALDGLFKQLFEPQEKIALIGSGCSAATEATAEISHYYNITHISCTSSSHELSDRVRFPYYFQLLPSEVNLAHVFYSIIREYGWRRVALIVQNEYKYKATMSVLKQLLSNSSTSIEFTETKFAHDSKTNIDEIEEDVFDPDSRIFVVAMASTYARRLICIAHSLGMKYPRHLFLTYGSYEPQWWSTDDSENHCSPEQRAEVLQFSFAALHYPPSTESQTATKDHDDFEFEHVCRDAVWSLALALNKTIEETTIKDVEYLDHNNGNVNLTYSNRNALTMIKKNLEDTDFLGRSGQVHFDESGIRRVTELQVLQYRTTFINGTPIITEDCNFTIDSRLRLFTVAFIHKDVAQFNLEFPVGNRNSIWPNYIPVDGIPRSEIATISTPVSVIFILLEVCGIKFAAVCLIFNIMFRNKKLIRLSSPNLNYILIFGIILVYLTGVFFVIPTSSPMVLPSLCIIRAWLLSLGYSCGFGTSVAKLWRVYCIFRKPEQTKRNAIKDWHLMVFASIMVLIDVVILTFYTLLEALLDNFGTVRVPNKENPSAVSGELEIETLYYIYLCSTRPWIRYLSLGLLYGYKCVLQICALYFAFQTRKVKVKGLNEAKFIAVIVYIVTIVLMATLVSTFALRDYVNVYAIIYCVGLALSGSTILGLTFIPKMVMLYRDPSGEKIFSDNEERVKQVTSILEVTPLGENEIDSLKTKIKHLEDAVTEYKRIIGIDASTTSRGRSSSLLEIRCGLGGFRQQWREFANERGRMSRLSVDIVSESHANAAAVTQGSKESKKELTVVPSEAERDNDLQCSSITFD